MNEEYHSLLANDTWDLFPLPKGKKLIRCKWVYRTKFGPDGKVDKLKGRLIAKGFSQVEDIDYTKTFSPVTKMNSIFLVLSLASSFKWEVHHMDVKSTKYIWNNILDLDKQNPALCYSDNTVYTKKVEAYPLLVSFTDFDWVGDPDDWKSIAGYVFTLGSRLIRWAYKKQSAISLSSVEVEYFGVIEACKEVLWLRLILSEFGFQQQHLITLWCHNQSAIQLCKDPVQHQCMKHIEIHMHFIRKLIHDHVLVVQYCSIDDQVVDIFTKAITKVKFTKLRFMVGVEEVVTKGG
eukprot:PITA_11759